MSLVSVTYFLSNMWKYNNFSNIIWLSVFFFLETFIERSFVLKHLCTIHKFRYVDKTVSKCKFRNNFLFIFLFQFLFIFGIPKMEMIKLRYYILKIFDYLPIPISAFHQCQPVMIIVRLIYQFRSALNSYFFHSIRRNLQ